MNTVLQYILYLAALVALAIPLGGYIKKVMDGEKTSLSRVLTPCENAVYKVLRINKDEEMTWKKYTVSVLVFSGIGLVFLFLLQLLQGVLPGNPQGLSGVKWDLAFNTAASFVTNTNWQAYSGESTLSYLTQALGLTVQNFVSAATGIAVLFAMIRGFIKVKSEGLGNFWVDLTRITIHILIPLNLVLSLALIGGGVIQNLKGGETVSLLEPIAVSSETFAIDADNKIIDNAEIDTENSVVTADGKVVKDAKIIMEGDVLGSYKMGSNTLNSDVLADSKIGNISEEAGKAVITFGGQEIPVNIVTEQFVPMGPAASQVARIAKANDMSEGSVREIIDKCTSGRFLGVFGEKTVNVLKVNLMLDGILTE